MKRRLAVVLALLLGLGLPVASQKKGKAPEVETAKDGVYVRLTLKSRAAGTGFLFVPDSVRKPKPGRKPGLIVMLHGHGSTPKNMMRTPLAADRGDCMLSVQGTRTVNTGGSVGFGWDAGGPRAINDLVRWVLANHPVDPKKVVLLGHSAGGAMVLRSCVAAPKLYGGMITLAGAGAPTSAHRSGRLVTFLGTDDANFSLAPSVRNVFGGKRKWKNGCLVVLVGAGHNHFPDNCQFSIAIDWCLTPKARGGEVRIPYEPVVSLDEPYHLIQLGHKGIKGWDDARGTKRRKGAAKKLAASIRARVARNTAYFPFEAMAHSDHAATFPLGGEISVDDLHAHDAAVNEAARGLKPGQMSDVIETAGGFHLVWRRPG